MNRAEETSGAMKFEETSTLNEGYLKLTSEAVGEGGRITVGPTKLHVTTVMWSLLSSLRPGNCSTRLRRDSFSAGNSLEHSLILQASERKSGKRH
ncbi:hypothetical protein ILYODFUR_033524 [Ilyodon furcidens]|uniref:Uncharacterized protein n=1 Tax=Ilyodon furcidens TaxID=33524 RepID=A0ABV0ST01_9TELE